jgi:acyl-CoA reductase-like NAD-dependent aldehyde dehydrogenase
MTGSDVTGSELTGSELTGSGRGAPPVHTSSFGAAGPVGTGPKIFRENPARMSEVVGEMSTCTTGEVDTVIAAAVAAQRNWARREVAERVALLRVAADAVERAGAALAPLLARELGKPVADSAGEMGFAAAFTRYVCDHVEAATSATFIEDAAGRVEILREPYGVVAAVVPWNAPLILAALKVAPAVATGNCIVVKPSPLAPFAVTEALRIMAAELPPGVISVVHGGPEVGAHLVGHREIAKVAFTGGEEVGRMVLHAAADSLTPTVMELGGNDPALLLPDLVFDDATMERLVFGVFLTSGQVCMAAKRIYVPNARLNEFIARFREVADRVLIGGDPLDPSVTIGPMVTAGHRRRVSRLVEEAHNGGAEVSELGRLVDSWDPHAGYFLRPTLVSAIRSDAPLVMEEQFGPTVPVVGYDEIEAAIEMANRGDLGLGSSVWSADEERAFEVGRRLVAGMTFINCHNRAGMSLRIPFGGVRRSGFGREFGEAGIAEYTRTHALHRPAAVLSGVSGRGYPA